MGPSSPRVRRRLIPHTVAVDVALHAGLGDAPDYAIRSGLSVRVPR